MCFTLSFVTACIYYHKFTDFVKRFERVFKTFFKNFRLLLKSSKKARFHGLNRAKTSFFSFLIFQFPRLFAKFVEKILQKGVAVDVRHILHEVRIRS